MVRCSDVTWRSNILAHLSIWPYAHPLSLGKIVLTMLFHRLSLNSLLYPVIAFGFEFTFTKCHSITANFYYCPTPFHVSIVGAHPSSRSLSSFYWGRSIAAGTLDCTVLVVGISKDPSLSSISTGDQTPSTTENRHSNYFAGVLFVSWQRDDHHDFFLQCLAKPPNLKQVWKFLLSLN